MEKEEAGRLFHSQGSTLPNTPRSFSKDVLDEIEDDVFALLRPLNHDAYEAFNAAVNVVIKDPDVHEHTRQFLHSNSRSLRESSVFTDDSAPESEPSPVPQWVGCFKFSLKVSPSIPVEGWYLGTGRGRPKPGETDILLAPPTQRWARKGVAGRHARLYFHRESCRVILEARHSVIFGGAKEANILSKQASQVLEQGQVIGIGGCLYAFEYTAYYTNSVFVEELSAFMKCHHGPQWMIHRMLPPASGGDLMTMGRYTCTPGAFAQGTFGQVTAGWARDGKAVAIKRFKNPYRASLDSHRKMMDYIGKHENILTLLDCISDFNVEVPGAYCIYSPLAVGSLKDVIEFHHSDISAQISLLFDYLKGLTYLHEQKGVMHRDINPNNLGIIIFNPPQGIILDLDSATRSETSEDHMQGTISYLAPEIMELKRWDESRIRGLKPEPYGRTVDVWALGLSAYSVYMGRSFYWNDFAPAVRKRGFVEDITYQNLCNYIIKRQTSEAPQAARLLALIRAMINWGPQERFSAATALLRVQALAGNEERGSINPRTGLKRHANE